MSGQDKQEQTAAGGRRKDKQDPDGDIIMRLEYGLLNSSSLELIGKINRLEVTASNKGEHVYLPSLMVSLAPPLVVFQPPHQCIFHSSELVYNLTNPLKSSAESV
ncbi:uncharacterized protein LOC126984852 isoform X1 [Eriocheir sinensis]|nr:uncharacterized protein LOC126984783 isoform X5 [Eriocheir sinensis]XP_050695012.1 uncharacterized protein LOC126984852 isoform X1 [Eriocheir sinensis]